MCLLRCASLAISTPPSRGGSCGPACIARRCTTAPCATCICRICNWTRSERGCATEHTPCGCGWRSIRSASSSRRCITQRVPGTRTQAAAHAVVHDLRQRLAPTCLPVFTSDGLNLYFYDTAGEPHPQPAKAEAAVSGASRAKADWRVYSRGTSINQARTRNRFSAVAIKTFWRRVFVCPR